MGTKVNTIQNSTNAGEITPRLGGRTDTQVYFQGLAHVTGMLPTPYGTMEKPQGTRFVGNTKANGYVRTESFSFSTEQTYIISFGETYIRFFKDESQLYDGSVPYELVSPYSVDDLDDLYFVQSADVLFIYHPLYMTRQLTRTSHTAWTLIEMETINGPYLDPNTDTSITISAAATTGNTTLTANTDIFSSGHVGAYWELQDGYVEITGYADPRNVTCTVIETLSGTGSTSDWSEGAWSTYRGFPSCGTFHESRLVSASTTYSPRTIWGSKQYVYDDHEVDTTKESYAYSFECSSDQVNAIRWLSSGSRLSIGTSDSVWTATGFQGAISATNIDNKRQHAKGSADAKPELIGAATYYISADKRKIWEHQFNFNINGYDAEDVTQFSEHITIGKIKTIALQQSPHNYLWAVTYTGELLVMLRDQTQNVIGWVRLDAGDSDFYEDVSVIRQGDADQVWVVVRRIVDGVETRCHEFFEELFTPTPPTAYAIDPKEDLFYVQSGLSYKDLTTLEDITQANPAVITATGHSLVNGDRIRICSGGTMTELDSQDFTISNATANTFSIDVDSTAYTPFTTDGQACTWTDTLTNLDHLEGRTVQVFGDGNILPTQVVSSGAISLPREVLVAQVGLPISCKIKTLRIDAGTNQGSAQGRKKRLISLTIRFLNSLGFNYGIDFDETFDYEENQVIYNQSPALYSKDVKVKLPNSWNTDGQFVIEWTQPLPMNIVAMMPEVTTS